jgi:hypothetical protein
MSNTGSMSHSSGMSHDAMQAAHKPKPKAKSKSSGAMGGQNSMAHSGDAMSGKNGDAMAGDGMSGPQKPH